MKILAQLLVHCMDRFFPTSDVNSQKFIREYSANQAVATYSNWRQQYVLNGAMPCAQNEVRWG